MSDEVIIAEIIRLIGILSISIKEKENLIDVLGKGID